MLSQITKNSASLGAPSIIIWSCVLVGVIVLAFVVVQQVKKRLRDDDDENPAASTGFTLSDLRQLHRDGQITDEELDRAKVKIVEAARKSAQRQEHKPSVQPPPHPREEGSSWGPDL